MAIVISELNSIITGVFSENQSLDHQVRLNTYRDYWRFYLKKHWSYQRDPGDPTITLNYTRRIVDAVNNFTFKKGFEVKIPDDPATPENEQEDREFVRQKLEDTWRRNHKNLWMIDAAQQGAVTGDLFLRVSWDNEHVLEEPFARVDVIPSHLAFPEFGGPTGVDRKKLKRILVLTPVYEDTRADRSTRLMFPPRDSQYKSVVIMGEEWKAAEFDGSGRVISPVTVQYFRNGEPISDPQPSPIQEIPIVHIPNYPLSGEYYGVSDLVDIWELNRELNEKTTDISDIINYHGCVDEETEILTQHGWKRYSELHEGDMTLGLDRVRNLIVWQPVQRVNVYEYDGFLIEWADDIDALTTPNHRWLAERRIGGSRNYIREMVRTSKAEGEEVAVSQLTRGSRLVLGGGNPRCFAHVSIYSDEFVELLGWWISGGSLDETESGTELSFVCQLNSVKPEHVAEIRGLQSYFVARGETFTEQAELPNGMTRWYLGTELTSRLSAVAPGKKPTFDFLLSLTYGQAVRLFDVLLAANEACGCGEEVRHQDWPERRAFFQALCCMLGKRTTSYHNIRGNGVIGIYSCNTTYIERTRSKEVEYTGKVWCPTVETGLWFARRRGNTYWTGNSPVTIMSGAKIRDLERGANKVWAVPENAKVWNLEISGDLKASVEHFKSLKKAMLELGSVPEEVLGDIQPGASVSGVAMALKYLPIMEKRDIKVLTYGTGLRLVNRLILMTTEIGDPAFGQKMDQLRQGNKYRNDVTFPDPMPHDEAAELEKSRVRLELGLSTRRIELERSGKSQGEIESILQGVKEELEEENESMFDADKPSGLGRGEFQNARGGDPSVRGQKVSATFAKKASEVTLK